MQWNDLFPTARLKNGGMLKSNHRPLIVETEVRANFDFTMWQGLKCFEAWWLKEETNGRGDGTGGLGACSVQRRGAYFFTENQMSA